jgi:NADH-quinone oxidoreductase subunit H
MKTLFNFLIFPGFLFLTIAGGVISWVDRKLTARVQFRKGPPFLQPFYDIGKLLLKETIVPENSSVLFFLLAPVLALTSSVIAGLLIFQPVFNLSDGFNGDLIVIIYFLIIPNLSLLLGGISSGNPLSAVGASREIKLLISYEMPSLLAILAIVIKADFSIKLDEIIFHQTLFGPFIKSISGIISFIVILLCFQAKLGKVPFDLAEAETEILAGVYSEYSGLTLALFKLTQYILFFVLPSFITTLFFGGLKFDGINIIWSVLKIFLIVFLIILIRNTNPRLRIKDAMKFFFIFCNLLAVISIILSILGY